LVGRRQADLLAAGPGPDCLDAEDNNPRDVAHGGPGFDTAIVDDGDVVTGAKTPRSATACVG
jgi:hypothetical protein